MTTVIFGAAGGIGSALARAWPERPLLLAGRNEQLLADLCAQTGASHALCDVGYESHVRRALDGVDGELSTLVYAAGAARPEPVAGATAQATRDVWNANYFGALWALRHGLPRVRSGGRVYLLGARPELVTTRGFSQYAASKAALDALAAVARLERRGVTVTVVRPPAVNTGLWSAVGKVPRGAVEADVVAAAIIQDRFEGGGRDELLDF